MASQLSHNATPFAPKKFPIIVLCDSLHSPANIGALFRICEAFGVEEILFYNCILNIQSNRLLRTSRNTHQRVAYREVTDLASEVARLKNLSYTFIGLEITENSVPLQTLSLPKSSKTVLCIGGERHGISETLLEHTTVNTHITMYGENSSMNVIQATAIALFSLTKL
ncbi:TrmH family RNA methyltransferase [Altibacter sp.]|uniref:TrmH family RNA methyltransferase n=1 Tax=Altibacter sp. TaxID=2024823 RepID=UPI000C97C5EE|nr:TrmH family RNA methyltransferase [Altibacter sp.]MAP56019.1 RNA methyltransferase [Altibacter sp.]